MKILAWSLILIGVPFAACNWYSPFSQAISGKHSSMVPPLGGLLIVAGVYLLTGSVWWALAAIASDFALLALPFVAPMFILEAYRCASINLQHELVALDNGRSAVLRLYRGDHASIQYRVGGAEYGLRGKWRQEENGYLISAYLEDRQCRLVPEEEGFVATESTAEKDSTIQLDGLVFAPR